MAESGPEDQGIVAEERFVYLERYGFESDIDRNYLNSAIAKGFSEYGVLKRFQSLYLHEITA